MSIKSIEHCGVLIPECQQDGERRCDRTTAAHPNGIQVSEKRWLLVYGTRRFRGNDDDCSIIYQLREGKPDGRLIREGVLAKTSVDWQPDWGRPGVHYKKEHRHPCAFGIPKGAIIDGREALHGNVFVIQWIRVGREFDPAKNYVEGTHPDPEMVRKSYIIEWTQVRLNKAEDDIETIRPAGQLRQVGYESGPIICSLEDARLTFLSMISARPYNKECTEWVETAHFDELNWTHQATDSKFAARKYRFNVLEGCYEWVETGPYLFDSKGVYGSGHLVRLKEGWAVARVRSQMHNHAWIGRGLGWIRLEDPFAQPLDTVEPEPVCPPEPDTRSNATFYLCADGVLRCFAGEGTSSPYGLERDPLYCWDIDPDDGFRASNRRVVFDTVKAGLPLRPFARPMLDLCKLLFHQGVTQYLVHRVIVTAMNHEHVHTQPDFWIFPPINTVERETCGIYYAKITYDEVEPPPWSFPPTSEETS